MRAALALVALALLVAGCASGPDPKPSVKPAAVSPEASAPNAAASGTNATNDTMAMLPPVMIDYKGTSPTGLCTFGTPADQCQLPSAGSQGYHALDYKGQARHASIKVTYAAPPPGHAFYATVCTGPTSDQTKTTCKDYKTGPTGFVVEKDLMELPKSGAVAISVGSVSITPTPAGGMVFSGVDFSVQGALTVGP